MNYTLFKMRFLTPLHAGVKNLTDGGFSVNADTLFSALCHMAQAEGGEHGVEDLTDEVRAGRLTLSDALPYIDGDLYIPKPIMRVEGTGDYGDKKMFKSLKYLPALLMPEYLSGDFDAGTEISILDKLGVSDIRVRVALSEQPRPYHVGSFHFADNAGLYVIVGFKGEGRFVEFIEKLFTALSYSGLGGKRTSGLGRFEVCRDDAGELGSMIADSSNCSKFMTLGVSMARPDELEAALTGATYALTRRSGFVSSPDYSDSPVRKRDFYSFSAGSCFEYKFEGDVFDVSNGGRHPVYRYAKPMFLGIST